MNKNRFQKHQNLGQNVWTNFWRLMFGTNFWNQFLEPIFGTNILFILLGGSVELHRSSVVFVVVVVFGNDVIESCVFFLLLLSLHSLGFLLSHLNFLNFFLKALEARTSFPSTASSTSRKRRSSPWRTATRCDGGCGCFGCIHVGLLLCLDDIFLIPNPFIAKPIAHL